MALLHTPAPQHVMQLVVLVLHVVHVCVNYRDIVFSDKGSVLSSHHTSFLSTIFRILGRVVHVLCTCIHVHICMCTNIRFTKMLLCDNSLRCISTSLEDFLLLFAVLSPILCLILPLMLSLSLTSQTTSFPPLLHIQGHYVAMEAVASDVVFIVFFGVVDCCCLLDCGATGACGGTDPHQGRHCRRTDKGCCPGNRPGGRE